MTKKPNYQLDPLFAQSIYMESETEKPPKQKPKIIEVVYKA
jgi:hypothetical protein